MEKRKTVSVVVPCFNEEENVEALRDKIKEIFSTLNYHLELLYIDNCSTDNTIAILKKMAADDPTIKVIINARNFGTTRSHHYGVLQATGDAIITQAADFQEPPELIPQLIAKWEEGNEVVMGIRKGSNDSAIMSFTRKLYYSIAARVSDVELVKNFNGASLFDRRVIDIIRKFDDPYPYFRGMLAEVGMRQARVEFHQQARRRGISKNNFFSLYDVAINGITSYSRAPLRIVTFIGFFLAAVSFLVAFGYLIFKLYAWESFQLGLAPIVIGLFFINGIILTLLGVILEYIGSIHVRVMNRPLVVEMERINFDENRTND
ncbi:MAG: glycosyltransferase family 2 protein [Magnetococcales bacterium]|nr:glycosyltransferase family 2 protein [Magnetococcales bacterium]